MDRQIIINRLLTILVAAGSGLCWWPAMVEPSIRFPRWLLLIPIALSTGFATILAPRQWLRFVITCVANAFAGLCTGWALFPSKDPIANSFAPYVIGLAVLITIVVSLATASIARKCPPLSGLLRSTIWLALGCCVVFGPVGLAITPSLVSKRIAHNDGLGAARFRGLKNAVERTLAETGNPERICNGLTLRRYYYGPPFSDEDWQRIAGNAVMQDGYQFIVYCHEKRGYTIYATPFRTTNPDGTREFCTDESGKIGCSVEWNASRYACIPCEK